MVKLIMYEDNGNKCGKCQNHDFEVYKKGLYRRKKILLLLNKT